MHLSDGVCWLCDKEAENLEHMLFKCSSISGLWEKVEKVCSDLLQTYSKITYKDIVFGTINTDANAQVLNVLIFICKWQIWKRRNNLVYEQEFVEVEYLWKQCQWQFKNQINVLLRCSFIKGRCMKEVFHLLQNIQGEI